ncbi:MAG: hypothetical protein JW981_07310 [Anaerolineae bacterium]|nr:hypothetical protein [Anaerolineae bacterium]
MIDIWGVFCNSLWVLGLAVLLATWSYADYEASIHKQKTRDKFKEFSYALALDAGLCLFITGLALTEDRWWARLLWIVLGLFTLVDAGLQIRENKERATKSS